MGRLGRRGAIYVARDVVAFRARALSPTGGEGRFVQGDFEPPADGETGLVLRSAAGEVVAEAS